MQRRNLIRLLQFVMALAVSAGAAFAAATPEQTTAPSHRAATPVHRKHTHRKTALAAQHKTSVSGRTTPASLTRSTVRRRRAIYREEWTSPTFANSTAGDRIDGDDLVVRRAAVEALGPYNGTVVAVEPNSGRILSIVNQHTALTSGFQPCSTVKIPVALAALSEGLIDRSTSSIPIYGRTRMGLTEALAHSNNYYFATLGTKLGYDKWSYYAHEFGLGEKAGLNIEGEESGYFAGEPPKNGGMGMMTSFGEGITVTPLEQAALLSAVSNGGTLYYLQYPQSQAELDAFVPRVKRKLDIGEYIPQIKPGMVGAVEYGTARSSELSDPSAPICGKTGTCTGGTTHLGWFGSFNDFGQNRVVLVVLLTGGRGVSGPTAAQITGNIYRNLQQQGYFNQRPAFSPAILVPR